MTCLTYSKRFCSCSNEPFYLFQQKKYLQKKEEHSLMYSETGPLFIIDHTIVLEYKMAKYYSEIVLNHVIPLVGLCLFAD